MLGVLSFNSPPLDITNARPSHNLLWTECRRAAEQIRHTPNPHHMISVPRGQVHENLSTLGGSATRATLRFEMFLKSSPLGRSCAAESCDPRIGCTRVAIPLRMTREALSGLSHQKALTTVRHSRGRNHGLNLRTIEPPQRTLAGG